MPSPFDPEDVKEQRDDIDRKSMQARGAETPEEMRERISREHAEAMQRQGEQLSHVPDPPSHPPGAIGGVVTPTPFPVTEGQPKGYRIIGECLGTGEPTFVLRAKDLFSVMAITHYLDIIEKYGPEDLGFQQEIVDVLNEFKKWQRNNVNQVRYPD